MDPKHLATELVLLAREWSERLDLSGERGDNKLDVEAMVNKHGLAIISDFAGVMGLKPQVFLTPEKKEWNARPVKGDGSQW